MYMHKKMYIFTFTFIHIHTRTYIHWAVDCSSTPGRCTQRGRSNGSWAARVGAQYFAALGNAEAEPVYNFFRNADAPGSCSHHPWSPWGAVRVAVCCSACCSMLQYVIVCCIASWCVLQMPTLQDLSHHPRSPWGAVRVALHVAMCGRCRAPPSCSHLRRPQERVCIFALASTRTHAHAHPCTRIHAHAPPLRAPYTHPLCLAQCPFACACMWLLRVWIGGLVRACLRIYECIFSVLQRSGCEVALHSKDWERRQRGSLGMIFFLKWESQEVLLESGSLFQMSDFFSMLFKAVLKWVSRIVLSKIKFVSNESFSFSN